MKETIPKERVQAGQVWTEPVENLSLFVTGTRNGWWSGIGSWTNGRITDGIVAKDKKGNEYIEGFRFLENSKSVPEWARIK